MKRNFTKDNIRDALLFILIISAIIIFFPFLSNRFNDAMTVSPELSYRGMKANSEYIVDSMEEINGVYNRVVDLFNHDRVTIFDTKYSYVEDGLGKDEYKDIKDGIYPCSITDNIKLNYYIKNGEIIKITAENTEHIYQDHDEFNEFQNYAYFLVCTVYYEQEEAVSHAREVLFENETIKDEYVLHDEENHLLLTNKIKITEDNGYKCTFELKPYKGESNKIYLD